MEQGGIRIDAIMGCGGVTKNIEWLHIIADMTQKPIYLTEQSANAGILGCAIIAAVGTGRYSDFSEAGEQMVHVTKKVQPDPDKKEIYESVFQQYLELYHSLEHMMRG